MFIETIVGNLDDKRRWWRYRARVKALPASHRATVLALERYLTHFGMMTRGEVTLGTQMTMLNDLTAAFEKAAAKRRKVSAVTGGDPVTFAEAFFRHYATSRWFTDAWKHSLNYFEREFAREIERGINKERRRLVRTVARAESKRGAARK